LRVAAGTASAASGGSHSAVEATEPQLVVTTMVPLPAAAEVQQAAAVSEPP
jgi:hypothetical protein